jgi:ribonuclease BN (tRNA processing enzyme)
MDGQPSSSFALRVGGDPLLLVDCGLGVVQACKRHLGGVPRHLYLTHNHADHTGELPDILVFFQPHVYGHRDVLNIVRTHRLHDSPQNQAELIASATWVEADAEERLHLRLALPVALTMQVFRSPHSYLCYGFVLSYAGRPVLGYTGDSGYDEAYYAAITQAPTVVIDAREGSPHDHGPFEAVDAYAGRVPACTFWAIHHGGSQYRPAAPNLRLLEEGMVVPLLPTTAPPGSHHPPDDGL